MVCGGTVLVELNAMKVSAPSEAKSILSDRE
jgi:hypothetical protein